MLFRQVTISTPQDIVDAGTKLNFTVKTSSVDSFVGLRAIDKSVLLLKSGNDITRERVRGSISFKSATLHVVHLFKLIFFGRLLGIAYCPVNCFSIASQSLLVV